MRVRIKKAFPKFRKRRLRCLKQIQYVDVSDGYNVWNV